MEKAVTKVLYHFKGTQTPAQKKPPPKNQKNRLYIETSGRGPCMAQIIKIFQDLCLRAKDNTMAPFTPGSNHGTDR